MAHEYFEHAVDVSHIMGDRTKLTKHWRDTVIQDAWDRGASMPAFIHERCDQFSDWINSSKAPTEKRFDQDCAVVIHLNSGKGGVRVLDTEGELLDEYSTSEGGTKPEAILVLLRPGQSYIIFGSSLVRHLGINAAAPRNSGLSANEA